MSSTTPAMQQPGQQAHEQQEGQAHQKQDDGNENHSGQTDDAQCEQRNHGISPPFDGTSLSHPDKSVLKAFLKSDEKSPAHRAGIKDRR